MRVWAVYQVFPKKRYMLKIQVLRMIKNSKQDIGIPFKLGHTSCQSSILTPRNKSLLKETL